MSGKDVDAVTRQTREGLAVARISPLRRRNVAVVVGAMLLVSIIVSGVAAAALTGSPWSSAMGARSAHGGASSGRAASTEELGLINANPDILRSARTGFPSCPVGQAPWIHHLARVDRDSGGASSVDAALRLTSADVGTYTAYPFSARSQRGPVWIVAGDATFIANTLRDGTWVVSPATFNGCREIPAQYRRSPSQPTG